MQLYPPQSIEIDSVSDDTIPEKATDLRTPEINEKRQTKIEKSNSEESQEILPKASRVEADLSALKSHSALKTHSPSVFNVKIRNLSKINDCNFKYKISVGNTTRFFLLSHKCINE